MPIRFRCPHCHQLLGIARRKAGSHVHCPTCNASLLVPATDEASDEPEIPSPDLGGVPAPVADAPGSAGRAPAAHAPGSPLPPTEPAGEPAAAPPNFFDRDDFDALLKFSVSGPVEPRKSAAGSVHTPVPAMRNPPAQPAPAPPAPLPVMPPAHVEPFALPRPSARASVQVQAPAQLPPGSVVITPTKATVLTVVVILLLAVAFGAGLIVGRFL
jgi:hypothetical protein